MLRRAMGCGLLVWTLTACSSPPPFDVPRDDEDRPTVATVVDNIECEIAEARDDPANTDPAFIKYLNQTLGLSDFGHWASVVTLSLTVSDTGGLSPTGGLALSYIDPFRAAAQSFTFGGNGLLYQQRQRIFTETYTIDISKIPVGENCASVKAKWPRLNLEGDLEIKDQVDLGLHTFQNSHGSDYVPTVNTDNFGGTISFDVYKGITSLGPTWIFKNFKGISGGLGYQRDDLDKIVITFAPAKYTPPPHVLKGALASREQLRAYAAAQAAATSTAMSAASVANSWLVQTQAIQQLSQVLSAH